MCTYGVPGSVVYVLLSSPKVACAAGSEGVGRRLGKAKGTSHAVIHTLPCLLMQHSSTNTTQMWWSAAGGDSSLFTVGASRVFRRGRHVDYVGIDGLPGMYISNRLGLQALTDAAFHYGADSSDFEKYVETHVSPHFPSAPAWAAYRQKHVSSSRRSYEQRLLACPGVRGPTRQVR